MDCIREAENYLKYYRELHTSISHAEYMIEQLISQAAPRQAGAAQYDVTGIRMSKPVNTLNQIYQLQKWQEMRERTLTELGKVDEILDSISQDPGCERYKDILIMWYIDKIDKYDIAERIGYSHRQSVYEIRTKAIRKFAVALFGVTALQAI